MSADVDRRLQISLRLKAARWLAGYLDDRGKARPLSTADLAGRDPLRDNRITRNRLEDIEQMRTPHVPRAMELEQIERALDLPGWFARATSRSRGKDATTLDLAAGRPGDQRHDDDRQQSA